MIETSRRHFLRGLFAAPAIIALDRLMPVKAWVWIRRPTTLWIGSSGLIGFGANLVFPTLAEALAAGVAGDTIRFGPLYSEPLPSDGFMFPPSNLRLDATEVQLDGHTQTRWIRGFDATVLDAA